MGTRVRVAGAIALGALLAFLIVTQLRPKRGPAPTVASAPEHERASESMSAGSEVSLAEATSGEPRSSVEQAGPPPSATAALEPSADPRRVWIVRVSLGDAPIEGGPGQATMRYVGPRDFEPEIFVDFQSARFDVDFTAMVESPRSDATEYADGPFSLRLDHPSFLPVEVEVDLASARVSRPEPGVELHVIEREVDVLPGARLVGRVVHGGVGLAKAWVVVVQDDALHTYLSSSACDESGAFSLRVPAPSSVLVVAGQTGYRPRAHAVSVSHSAPQDCGSIEIDEGLSIEGRVDAVQVGNRPGRVSASLQQRGSSVDYPGTVGSPELAWVGAQLEYSRVFVEITASGVFSFTGLGPHVYDLEYTRRYDHVVVRGGDSVRVVGVVAPAVGILLDDDLAPRVEFLVLSAGEPVPGAEFTLSFEERGEARNLPGFRSGRDGRVSFVLAPGETRYAFRIVHKCCAPTELTVGSLRLGDVVRQSVELQPLEVGDVRLLVRADGRPLETLTIELDVAGEALPPIQSEAGPDGRHVIAGVAAGACVLRVTSAGFWNAFVSPCVPAEVECTVRRDETTELELELEVGGQLSVSVDPPSSGNCNVGCSVLSADGQKLDVVYMTFLDGAFYSGVCPRGRSMVLPALPPGSYRVRLDDARYQPREVSCVVERGKTTDVVLALEPR